MSISKNVDWSNVIETVYNIAQEKDGGFLITLARTLGISGEYQVCPKTYQPNLYIFTKKNYHSND